MSKKRKKKAFLGKINLFYKVVTITISKDIFLTVFKLYMYIKICIYYH